MAIGELPQPVGLAADRVAQHLGVRGAHVDEPVDAARRAAVRAVTGPTPHNASTGSFCRKRSIRSGAMTVRPSGFFQPDAIFARNLLGATPADAVSDGRVVDLRLEPQRHRPVRASRPTRSR